jgi:hypothetical protein
MSQEKNLLQNNLREKAARGGDHHSTLRAG